MIHNIKLKNCKKVGEKLVLKTEKEIPIDEFKIKNLLRITNQSIEKFTKQREELLKIVKKFDIKL